MALTITDKPDKDGNFRIVNAATGVLEMRTDNNAALDSGGSSDRAKLLRMAGHIQDSMDRKNRPVDGAT